MNAENDGQYKKEARERYMEARKKLDLSETPQNAEQNWILYIGEDEVADALDFDIHGEDTDDEDSKNTTASVPNPTPEQTQGTVSLQL